MIDAAERDEFAPTMNSNGRLLSCISDLAVAVEMRGSDGNRAVLILPVKRRFEVVGGTGMHVSGEVTLVLCNNVS